MFYTMFSYCEGVENINKEFSNKHSKECFSLAKMLGVSVRNIVDS